MTNTIIIGLMALTVHLLENCLLMFKVLHSYFSYVLIIILQFVNLPNYFVTESDDSYSDDCDEDEDDIQGETDETSTSESDED